jgi:hypothetical protein
MFPTQSYACTTEEVAVGKVVLNTVQMMGQLGVHCPWHVSGLGHRIVMRRDHILGATVEPPTEIEA